MHDRSPGRSTPSTPLDLGIWYFNGKGVQQDYAGRRGGQVVPRSVEQGCTRAHALYQGDGVPQDYTKCFKWIQLAAEQGCKDSLATLNSIAQHNQPHPNISTVLFTSVVLTSAVASKYSMMKGGVVAPAEGRPAAKVAAELQCWWKR